MNRYSVVPVELADDPYPVVVGRGILDALLAEITLPAGAANALIVTQQPIVDAGHVAPVEAALSAAGLQVHRRVVPDGEPAKELSVLASLWQAAAQVPLSRSDVVVAVGGGVVGDLAGFTAAAFNRGIAVLQVPTTLLAQVDASVGGKTGINLPEGKNLVGAFHQPIGVVCDVDVLTTLSSRVLLEGFGEIVKAGLIQDPVILELLESSPAAAAAGEPGLLEELVRRSIAVKAAVVAADEREGGVRTFLNLGHTYAHAVETLSGYGTVLHGEAVAIGTVVALRLGLRLGRTPPEVVDRGEAILAELGLPVRGPLLERDAVWQVMARDKKAGRDGVRFVLLDDLAVPTVLTPSRDDVDAVLDELTDVPRG